MTTQFNSTPEELDDAEASARLIDDVLAGRNIQNAQPQDLHTAHLLRTLDTKTTTPSVEFKKRIHTGAQMLFPRQVSWFYRFRFILVGIPVVGSMAVVAFAFTHTTTENPATIPLARTTTLNSNTLSTPNADSQENTNTRETQQENNQNTSAEPVDINQGTQNTHSTTPIVNTADTTAQLTSLAADIAALNALEADLSATLASIDELIADSAALDTTDTLSADINSLSQELSTL